MTTYSDMYRYELIALLEEKETEYNDREKHMTNCIVASKDALLGFVKENNFYYEENQRITEENKMIMEENKRITEENKMIMEENKRIIKENKIIREENDHLLKIYK